MTPNWLWNVLKPFQFYLRNRFSSRLIMTEAELRRMAENRIYPGFKEGSWSGPFFFIQGADTQFGMISSYVKKELAICWEKEMELAQEAIRAINAMDPKPRFFVVCGDLVDAFPGNQYRGPQVEDFKRVFRDLDPSIPLVCVCGNHDVGNQPTPSAVQDYRDKFGDDFFSFLCGGVLFLVLNSQYYEDDSLVPDLAREQEAWLDERLEEARSGRYRHVVVFQHIPYFLREPDEEKDYFNLEPGKRLRLLRKLYDAKVRAVFCGHYHRNAGGFYRDLELVVTSAVGCQLGQDRSGFRVVKVDSEAITHRYYAFEDAPRNVTLD